MTDPEAVLTIGEVARRAGVRASRIRYYESIGVLPAADRVSGKRRYTPAVLRRLTVITAAQRIGFTLAEIAALLGPGKRPTHERLRVLAIDKLPEIDQLIQRAITVRKLLVTCAVCDCDSLDQCRILDDALALDDPHSGRPTVHARDPTYQVTPSTTTRRDPGRRPRDLST